MKKLIVFSCDSDTFKLSADDMMGLLQELWRHDIRIRPATGYYKGVKENSFICLIETQDQFDLIKTAAELYKQECFLEVDQETKFGYLRYLEGSADKYVGKWTEIKNTHDILSITTDLTTGRSYKCVLTVKEQDIVQFNDDNHFEGDMGRRA